MSCANEVRRLRHVQRNMRLIKTCLNFGGQSSLARDRKMPFAFSTSFPARRGLDTRKTLRARNFKAFCSLIFHELLFCSLLFELRCLFKQTFDSKPLLTFIFCCFCSVWDSSLKRRRDCRLRQVWKVLLREHRIMIIIIRECVHDVKRKTAMMEYNNSTFGVVQTCKKTLICLDDDTKGNFLHAQYLILLRALWKLHSHHNY